MCDPRMSVVGGQSGGRMEVEGVEVVGEVGDVGEEEEEEEKVGVEVKGVAEEEEVEEAVVAFIIAAQSAEVVHVRHL